jgi:hypothetical protein
MADKRLLGAQGDQIGRIFAQCVIVTFGQFMKITEIGLIFGATFCHG